MPPTRNFLLDTATQSPLCCDSLGSSCRIVVESLGLGARLLGVHLSAQNFQAVEP